MPIPSAPPRQARGLLHARVGTRCSHRTTLLLLALAGCATTVVRNEFNGIVVGGPLAGPFATPDGVVDALPLLLEQPGATDGDLGVECFSNDDLKVS